MELEINSCKNYEILEVRQGDKGSRIIDFTFTVNGEVVDLTSAMSAKVNATVDDVIVADSVAAVVDTENNVVTVTLTDTMLALSGICKMDIVLTEGDEIITAETVCLRVGKSVINDDSKAFPGASSIAEITKEVETARGSSSSLNARLNGIDSAVTNKAEKSTVSQLSARMQSAETSLAGKANATDVANALKGKEDDSNKVSSKTDITDSRANYPSIEYLDDYYYSANEIYSSEEIDELLGNKADSNSFYSKVEADNLLGGKADKADVSKLKDDIGDRNITLDFNYDGYIDKKGEFNTLVSFKTTDFIAISSRVIVKGEFRDLNSPLYYINCYDSNKNYLGGTINAISSGNKIVNVNGVVTLIEGTCFIRVTNSRRSISMVKMGYSLSDTGDLSSVNQKIEESKTNNSIYSNIINDGLGFSVFSKFASVGDSLSVGYNTEKDGTPISEDLKHSWGAYIEKRCGTKSFWTGKSGQTCKTWLNTTSETWGLNYCKSIGTMPLYVICMGANEPGINIGTTDDIDTDNDTLYGYVSKVINELRNISPKSYIVCTGVSREQNSHSINDVYKTICELKEKCYYLDCFKEFNSEPFTSYFFNWHYSANGYSAMANLFDYKLKEVMAKNVEDFKYVNEADN
jgi:hypothetical protein